MKHQITYKLKEIETQLIYFQPTNEWQPQKYNVFLQRLEEIIKELLLIIEELKNENTNQVQLKIAEDLLQKYFSVREKYF